MCGCLVHCHVCMEQYVCVCVRVCVWNSMYVCVGACVYVCVCVWNSMCVCNVVQCILYVKATGNVCGACSCVCYRVCMRGTAHTVRCIQYVRECLVQ